MRQSVLSHCKTAYRYPNHEIKQIHSLKFIQTNEVTWPVNDLYKNMHSMGKRGVFGQDHQGGNMNVPQGNLERDEMDI